MKKSEITQKVINLIKELIDEDEITADSYLQDDVGLDSLDAVELIMRVESEFEISIPDDDAEQVKTVQQMVDLVHKIKSA